MGDEIVVVVQKARPISAVASQSATALKIRRGDVRRAVVVRTKKEVIRPDGRKIRFDDNAAVLINAKKELLATRINGVVNADLRMKGWGKIASVAPKVRFPSMFPLRRANSTSGHLIVSDLLSLFALDLLYDTHQIYSTLTSSQSVRPLPRQKEIMKAVIIARREHIMAYLNNSTTRVRRCLPSNFAFT